jgi:hypothetical protein
MVPLCLLCCMLVLKISIRDYERMGIILGICRATLPRAVSVYVPVQNHSRVDVGLPDVPLVTQEQHGLSQIGQRHYSENS